MASEAEHAHDDITTQLVESIGLDCAIMAISRYCDRIAVQAENNDSQCLAFVYRTIASDLWRTTNTLLSGDICHRWRQIQRETK